MRPRATTSCCAATGCRPTISAVVLDDAAQGVTTIVRGVDLLDSTAAHVHLQGVLGVPTPAYWHLPIVVNDAGPEAFEADWSRAGIGR